MKGEISGACELAMRRIADIKVLHPCWQLLGLDTTDLSLKAVLKESISSILARTQLAMSSLQQKQDESERSGEEHADAAVALAETLTHFAYCTSSDLLSAHRGYILMQQWGKSVESELADAALTHVRAISTDMWRHSVTCTIVVYMASPILAILPK